MAKYRRDQARVFLVYGIPAFIALCVLSGCTGTIQRNDPNSPSVYWKVYDQATHSPAIKVNASSGPPGTCSGSAQNAANVWVSPGDDYVVTFWATSHAGIKSIKLTGNGEAACHDGKLPAGTKPYNIEETLSFAPPSGGEGIVEAPAPYFFFWGPVADGSVEGPAIKVYSACKAKGQLPLLGYTTYTGDATPYSDAIPWKSCVTVRTCNAGLSSSPSQSCQ